MTARSAAHRLRRLPLVAAVAILAMALGGCASSPEPAASDSVSGELTVSAAASLQGAFDQAIDEFAAAHPEVRITATYDGSSTLATQISGGAKVDVFASADEANMAVVIDQGLAENPTVFAHNTLVVVTPKGNPAGIESLDDLDAPGVTVVLCSAQVPCGAASQQLLEAQRVKVTPASQEQNVTAVLTKVRADEADAGLVYRTDAATTDEVESFAPEGADQVVNAYPVVALDDSANPVAAHAFIEFITSADGQRILRSFGFGSP